MSSPLSSLPPLPPLSPLPLSAPRLSSPRREFALQFSVAAVMAGLALLLGVADWRPVSLMIGLLAFLLAWRLRSPLWWRVIHLVFAPLLCLAFLWQKTAAISPFWWLAAFLLTFLVFRGAAGGRIPLYLSGEGTARQLADLLPKDILLLDAGAGLGSLLLPLAARRPDLTLSGLENAPLPWLTGKLRAARVPRLSWQWGDFWRHSFTPYDAVYCFLSPAPMTALWAKACQEMKPGSLLISKAFPIADVPCESLAAESDSPVDTLYLYRIPESASALG